MYTYTEAIKTSIKFLNLSERKKTHDYEGLKLNKYSASQSRRFKLKNIIDGKNSSASLDRLFRHLISVEVPSDGDSVAESLRLFLD